MTPSGPATASGLRAGPSADHWYPEDADIQAATRLLQAELPSISHYLSDADMEMTQVDAHTVLGVECYSAPQTEEHDDTDFPEWTALLVLQANGHTLATGFNEDLTESDSTPVIAGQVLLFRIHSWHALNLSDDAFQTEDVVYDQRQRGRLVRDHLFVAAHVDFDMKLPLDVLPSRADVETLLREQLQPVHAHRHVHRHHHQ